MTQARSSDRLTLALVQADLIWGDPEANRRRLAELMDRQPGADLYVLPETFTTAFLGDEGAPDEPMAGGPTLDWLRDQAARRGAAVCGSYVVVEEGCRHNRFVFVDEAGEYLGHYDKRHLFGPGGEGQRYTPGQQHTLIEWQGWRIDLQVCYDLRFPVWCRNDRDFDLQLFVANWPSPRTAHWQALLRARAIENQAYVIGVNRVGVDGKQIPYSGASLAFGPAGETLLELDDSETVAPVVLSRSALEDYRAKLPFLNDRDLFLRQT
jgi:predicted amidohydrolase